LLEESERGERKVEWREERGKWRRKWREESGVVK
jgi:hypothetical protein